ncbi:hypothetical protein V6Z12_D01G183600 [Gossypium hirsutum]
MLVPPSSSIQQTSRRRRKPSRANSNNIELGNEHRRITLQFNCLKPQILSKTDSLNASKGLRCQRTGDVFLLGTSRSQKQPSRIPNNNSDVGSLQMHKEPHIKIDTNPRINRKLPKHGLHSQNPIPIRRKKV